MHRNKGIQGRFRQRERKEMSAHRKAITATHKQATQRKEGRREGNKNAICTPDPGPLDHNPAPPPPPRLFVGASFTPMSAWAQQTNLQHLHLSCISLFACSRLYSSVHSLTHPCMHSRNPLCLLDYENVVLVSHGVCLYWCVGIAAPRAIENEFVQVFSPLERHLCHEGLRRVVPPHGFPHLPVVKRPRRNGYSGLGRGGGGGVDEVDGHLIRQGSVTAVGRHRTGRCT
mmetsp:Transcript_40254/g.79389  ORF Transcript_40254/g.79389 Transcript_40254/m.79389 type:complete len:229 (-) Transcript_40254:2235-2921(-)